MSEQEHGEPRMHVAVFPGTFDPVTNGHLDLMRRGAAIFDALVVAVVRAEGRSHFPLAQRIELLETALEDRGNTSVVPFDGLLVEFARQQGAKILLRGVRGVRDFEYELEMAWANRGLAPELETVFLAPSPETALVSSSLVREVASLGGDVSLWVPRGVVEALRGHPPTAPGGEGARKVE